jgi:hypothetical protein
MPSPLKFRSTVDWKFLAKRDRNWSYDPPSDDFYCTYCNNLDPFQHPRDARGKRRGLEPDPLGPALRRPILKDFTGRRNFLNKGEFVARQPSRWQYLEGRRLTFDIPYEDLFDGARNGCPSCALLFDAAEKFEAPGYVRDQYLDSNILKLLPGGETANGIDPKAPHDVAGLYVDIVRFSNADGFSTRVCTFSGIELDFHIAKGESSSQKHSR